MSPTPRSPVTYRSRPNLSPWAAGLDLDHLARRRPALRRGPPRRPHLHRPRRSTAPLKLAGTPLVHLVASTSGTDSDWVVKLIDVYPDLSAKAELGGYQFAIAMDVMRGRYRDRPRAPRSRSPPTSPLTYEFALPTVDYALQPGHRLMVQVQSSWFPLVRPQPADLRPQHLLRESRATIAPPPSASSPAPTAAGSALPHRQVTLRDRRRASYLAQRR